MSPCLFNLYTEYVKLNVGLNQAQAGILVAEMVKHLSAMQETWVPSLSQEDPLEKGMVPTAVFLLGEFHGQRSLEGYSP